MQLGWVNVTFCHTPTIYLSHMKQNDQAPRQRDLLIQIVCEQQDVWPLTQARAVLWERFVLGFTMLTVSHRQHFPGKWRLINEPLSRVYNLNEKENTRRVDRTDWRGQAGGPGRSESQNVNIRQCLNVWPWATSLTCMVKTLDSTSQGVRAVRKSERKHGHQAALYQTQFELYIAMKVWPWATSLTCMVKTLDSTCTNM